jgi:hypothetical protein
MNLGLLNALTCGAVFFLVVASACARAPQAQPPTQSDPYLERLRYEQVQSALSDHEIRELRFSYC